MNRASWNAQRRRIRDSYPNRAERGLPKHPDGSGLAPCPRCGSEGCRLCDGSTFVADGYRDPLLRLCYARQAGVRRKDPNAYMYLRQLCARPAWQLRLLEVAFGCELATHAAVEAWRKAA